LLLQGSLLGPFYADEVPVQTTDPFVTTRLLVLLGEATLGESPFSGTSRSYITSSYSTPTPAAYNNQGTSQVFSLPSYTTPAPQGPLDPTTPYDGIDFDPGDEASGAAVVASSPVPAGSYVVSATSGTPDVWSRFLQIGQSLWTLVLGLAGGIVAHALFLNRQKAAGPQVALPTQAA